MKTPKFWRRNGILALCLTPFSWVYGALTQLRIKRGKPYHSSAKVICVGNITAGGVGKTPVAMAIAERYLAKGKKVFFVTRGYKGKLKNVLVDLKHHSVKETGDEARLLAGVAPTIIAPRREVGAKMAESLGAEIIIMDDGFQNPGLYKDESYLVFDGEVGIGNGKIIPAGPLRETLESGEKRAQHIIIMGEDKTGLYAKCKLDVSFGRLEAVGGIAPQRVAAFAGIGRPEKFYQTLQSLGFEVVKRFDYPDHYAYKESDVAFLKAEAKAFGLKLITTEKDFVKINDDEILFLKVRAVF